MLLIVWCVVFRVIWFICLVLICCSLGSMLDMLLGMCVVVMLGSLFREICLIVDLFVIKCV